MSAHQSAHVVQLGPFQPATFLAEIGATVAPAVRHPEAAGTACQCSAPEPCWTHDPALGIVPAAAAVPLTAPMPAVGRPRPTPYPRPVSAATAAAGAALEAAVDAAEVAATVCQCVAPEPCTAHPDEWPLLTRPPAWNEPHPDSPVGRTRRRLAHDRAAGVLPGAEPGQGAAVLPYLTDHELGAWTQAVLAEHHRRQSRFADYRRGATQAKHRFDRKDAS